MKAIKEINQKELIKILTPPVEAYLAARAFAETQRDNVNKIAKDILETASYCDPKDNKRITNPTYAWLLSDQDSHDYLTELRHRLVKAGYDIKQAEDTSDSWDYYCPALIAEGLQRKVEHLLIDTASNYLELGEDFGHKLLCHGLDKYHQFIDLHVGLVVNLGNIRIDEFVKLAQKIKNE